MTNKKLGNDFETELCDILSTHGFWCHNMAMNHSGQPADIIAVRNSVAYLIDAKVCTHDKFPIDRIEENQRTAMELWSLCGNGTAWFAFALEDSGHEIVMISYDAIVDIAMTRKTLTRKFFDEWGYSLREWVALCV